MSDSPQVVRHRSDDLARIRAIRDDIQQRLAFVTRDLAQNELAALLDDMALLQYRTELR